MKNVLLGALGSALMFFAFGTRLDARQSNAMPASPQHPATAQLVEPAEAQKLIAGNKVTVLDVRTPAEYAAGHIAGATNIDFHAKDFQTRVAALDKSKTYLVHCAAGVRSAKACTAMGQLDFKNFYDLKGGLTAWQKAGLPVEK